MILIKRIGFIFPWVFFLCLTAFPAITTVKAEKEIIIKSKKEAFQRGRLLIAQNSRDGEENNATGSTVENDSKQNPEKKTQKQAPTSKSKTAPLTTFEPSEKVKADQTVDFPYDI